jgi:hypothetical protein
MHRKKYHQPVLKNVIYLGKVCISRIVNEASTSLHSGSRISEIRRDPVTAKFPCPCGLPAHARYSSTKIHFLCRSIPHPTDPDAQPDSDDETPNQVQHDLDVMDIDLRRQPPSPHPPSPLPDDIPLNDASHPDKIEYCDDGSEVSPTFEDGESDGGIDGDESNDVGYASADAVDSAVIDSARKRLRAIGIDVEPEYGLTICIDCSKSIHYAHIHGHRKSQHCYTKDHHRALGSKDAILELLVSLNAHRQRTLPSTPIPPIRTLALLTAYRCGVPNCTETNIFASKKLVSEHCMKFHPTVAARRRPCIPVPAQKLGYLRGVQRYIEVLPVEQSPLTDNLSDIFRQYQDLSVGVKSTDFQPANNVRARSEFLCKTRWDTVLEGVELSTLRGMVAIPDQHSEQSLCRLRSLVRAYYHEIASGLTSTLPTLVLRYIHSPDPE